MADSHRQAGGDGVWGEEKETEPGRRKHAQGCETVRDGGDKTSGPTQTEAPALATKEPK